MQLDARKILQRYRGRGLFVTATDTDVGKTTITAALAAALVRQGVKVGICKPVASGCPTTPAARQVKRTEDLRSPDAEITLVAAGLDPTSRLGQHEAVLGRTLLDMASPVLFAIPVSPHIAARLEERTTEWDRVAEALAYWETHCDFLLVEGAGGWQVPLDSTDFTIADLATILGLPVLVVTGAALGILNVAVLTVQAIRARGLEVVGLVANHVPPLPNLEAQENLRELPRLCAAPLRGVFAQSTQPLPRTGLTEEFVTALEPWARSLKA
ncbi:MAG: dethiobiotin synthase [Phycisphaerae bacterium]